ncbi:MAG: hypothetical protein IPM06_05260 [Rhizobiales bacterium]|nr:hypothetical protein [Hyphomicrobiales bacterium]
MAFCGKPATEILSCPPEGAGGLAVAIRARGNIPVSVGASCMFELTPDDIRESWLSAQSLRAEVAGAMVAELAHRLCTELAGDEHDEEQIAGEAAACLFLAIRHHNLPLDDMLRGCRISFDDRRRAEAVESLTA